MAPKKPTKSLIAQGVRSWKEARSYAEICELTAQFIEGRCAYYPGYGAPEVDDETHEIASYLAALNRAGFLTTGSQPGAREQRAFVDGYAPESIARLLARVTLYTDLYVLVVPPTANGGYHIPVGVEHLQPCIWTGFSSFSDLDTFGEACRPEVMRKLVRSWAVSAIDLRWGRRDYLWQNLCAALDCYSEVPVAELAVGDDFAGPVEFEDKEKRLARFKRYGVLPLDST